MDLASGGLTDVYPFVPRAPGVRTYRVPLDTSGGMQAELMALVPAKHAYHFEANYVLVLDGSCLIDTAAASKQTLVVTPTVQPWPFEVSAAAAGSCLALSVTFLQSGEL